MTGQQVNSASICWVPFSKCWGSTDKELKPHPWEQLWGEGHMHGIDPVPKPWRRKQGCCLAGHTFSQQPRILHLESTKNPVTRVLLWSQERKIWTAKLNNNAYMCVCVYSCSVCPYRYSNIWAHYKPYEFPQDFLTVTYSTSKNKCLQACRLLTSSRG